ncbi:hypothetical protein ACHWQZ_G012559 [Mnemiopsis leidyi]
MTSLGITPALNGDMDGETVIGVTDTLTVRASQIRSEAIMWQPLLRSAVIKEHDYQVIAVYDTMTKEQQMERLKVDGLNIVKTLINLTISICNEKILQHVLVLVNDVLTNKDNISLFEEIEKGNTAEKAVNNDSSKGLSSWEPFLDLLNRPDEFIVNQSCLILAKVISCGRFRLDSKNLNWFINWQVSQLLQNNTYLHTILASQQLMLRVPEYRAPFYNSTCLDKMLNILSTRISFQLQYQMVFCFWLLSFRTTYCFKLLDFIKPTAEILRQAAKEKVIRIILQFYRNLLTNHSAPRKAAELMIQGKVQVVMGQLIEKNWKDEDIKEDVEHVKGVLDEMLQDMSTFDSYLAEVKSGKLEWSPLHTNPAFWRENAQKLNQNDHEVLRMIRILLKDEQDPTTLAVCAHDVGEYVRHYPVGKYNIEKLGLKERVVCLLDNDDPKVKSAALLALQKLMLNNWEFMAKTNA